MKTMFLILSFLPLSPLSLARNSDPRPKEWCIKVAKAYANTARISWWNQAHVTFPGPNDNRPYCWVDIEWYYEPGEPDDCIYKRTFVIDRSIGMVIDVWKEANCGPTGGGYGD